MKHTVSVGRDDNTSIRAWCICCAVPSKNFPQPPTNKVSPIHDQRERERKENRKRSPSKEEKKEKEDA